MKRSKVTAAEVLAAARAYALDPRQGGAIELTTAAYREIGAAVEFDAALSGRSWEERQAETAFGAQVLRAFNKLAEAGELRKAGAGTRGPDGQMIYRNSVRFYTPEAWDAAVARTAAAESASAELAARWSVIRDRLYNLGLDSTQPRGHAVRLAVEDWERLVELAEAGDLAVPAP